MSKRYPLIIAAAIVIAAGCSKKSKNDEDGDAHVNPDGMDAADGLEVVDGEDVPGDPASEDAVEDAELPDPPAQVLKYLGRYEHQDDGPDHLMATAILDAGPLVVASGSGVAVVDRGVLTTSTLTSHMGKYLVDTAAASNLDDAPTGTDYHPRFYGLDTRGTTIYAATRYDGLWILDASSSGSTWTVSEVRRHMRAREFTEGVQVVGDNLYVTHHADGLEVMDLSSDPQDPTTIDTLGAPLVDTWGVWAQEDGKVWVADGLGGVKLLRFETGTLTHITGDTVTTAPGTALDVAVIDTWVVAAMAGKGITVYEEWTGAQRNTYALDGVCVDIEPMGTNRFVATCRTHVHVVEIDSLGLIDVLATARLHGRMDGGSPGVHIGSHTTADGDVLFVSGWDHVDAYRLTDTDTDPDIHVSGQRAHFGGPPGVVQLLVWNKGQGTLEISDVACTEDSLTCTIGSTSIPPGGRSILRIVYDGSATNMQTLARINSNDPDDPVVGIPVLAALDSMPDPHEAAPDFTGSATERDYAAGTFTDSTLTLASFATAGEAVAFTVVGSWSPESLPSLAAMAGDMAPELPTGSSFFVIDQEEAPGTIRHVLEKTYIPLTVVIDADGSIADTLYSLPDSGLPFDRAFVFEQIDFAPYVTDTYDRYDPQGLLDDLADAL